MLNVLYGDPGPATLSLISNLIKASPSVLRMSLTSARQLAAMVASMDEVRHDVVLGRILDFLDSAPASTVNSSPYVASWSAAPPVQDHLVMPELEQDDGLSFPESDGVRQATE